MVAKIRSFLKLVVATGGMVGRRGRSDDFPVFDSAQKMDGAAATVISLSLTLLKKGKHCYSKRLTCVNFGLSTRENTPPCNGGAVGTPVATSIIVRQEHLTTAGAINSKRFHLLERLNQS